MKSITTSIGSADDLDAVETVENRCFAEGRRSSRRALRYGLRSPAQRMWIAWTRGAGGERQPAGVLTLHWRRHSVRIYSLAVMPASRGSGLGRLLVEKAFAEARRRDARYVSLEAERSARRLVRWYERLGFETVRILPDYYAAGEDAVLMRRTVARPKRKGDKESA
jgi:ribosomal protein S18 acetylase RimI-like enzyme